MIQSLLAVGLALLLSWAVLVIYLFIADRSSPGVREILRLLPDTLRLLHRMATDPVLPRGVKVRLWLLFAYLASPIDLIPDFVPVIGYVDDAIIIAAVLRSVVRTAGISVLRRNWPGSDDGFRSLLRAAGLNET